MTLRQTGHLNAIVSKYMRIVRSRLKKNHIATPARKAQPGTFSDFFYKVYDMEFVVFSIGNTTIGGRVDGYSEYENGVLSLEGNISFYLRDEFADPIGLGIEPGGDVYPITDVWDGHFKGRIYADEDRSKFVRDF